MLETMKKLKISKVISIDDSWKSNKEKYNSTKVSEYLQIKEKNFLKDVYLKFEKKLREKEIYNLEDFEDDISLKSFKEIKDDDEELYDELLKDDIGKIEATLEPLIDIFERKKDIKCKFKKLEFFKKKQIKIELGNDRVLFIVDIDINGNDIIPQVLKYFEDKETDYIMIIYSSDISSLNNKELILEYLERKELNSNLSMLIFPIEKTSDAQYLEKEIKNTILKSHLYATLYKFLKEKRNLDNRIYETIYKSVLYDFEDKVLKTLSDGEDMASLIRKLFQVTYNSIFFKNEAFMKNRKTLIQAANNYIELSSREHDRGKLTDKEVLSVIDCSVNESYKDIWTGDLFEINEGEEKKYGVIIDKACHLIVREKGEASKEKISLLELEEKKVKNNKSKKDEARKKTDNGEYIWPIKVLENEESIALKNKDKVFLINKNILDLCSFNSKGEATTKIDQESKEYKTYNVLKNCNINIDSFYDKELKDQLFDLIKERELSDENKNKINNILKKNIENKNIFSITEFSDSTISFSIRRLGRISSDKALALHQNYLFALSQRGIDSL